MNAVVTVCNIGRVEPISTSLISTFSVWRPKVSIIRFRRRRRRYPSSRVLARASLATEPVEGQAPSPSESESESVARRLILLRHAESSWERPSLRGSCLFFFKFIRVFIFETRIGLRLPLPFTDHDRPLSKAGQADAVIVSYKLQQLGWIPQLILSRLRFSLFLQPFNFIFSDIFILNDILNFDSRVLEFLLGESVQ